MGNFGFKNVSKRNKIDLMEYLCYGLGDFSFCFIYGAIGSYIVFFYTDVACISAATVGTVLLVSKIFDGISDMMMGYIIENVHSPLGKARPWLLWMVIPYCIGCVLLFTVPDFSETGKVIYAFISYNLMATCIFTSMNVPYGVLSSVMTNKQNERALLSISRASLGALGVFVISSYAPDLVEKFGGGPAGWQKTFLLVGIVSIGLFLITFFGCKERVGSGVMEQKTGKKSSLSLLQGVKIPFAEQSMGLMYLGLILRGMGVACISATKFGMIADSIEYGEYKTGTRAEGFVYSAASLGVRVGSALASAVIGWVQGAYGYDGKLAVQSETAMKGIRIMFYYAPLVVFIAILALLLFYKLDREYDGIMKVLDERHKLAEQANA